MVGLDQDLQIDSGIDGPENRAQCLSGKVVDERQLSSRRLDPSERAMTVPAKIWWSVPPCVGADTCHVAIAILQLRRYHYLGSELNAECQALTKCHHARVPSVSNLGINGYQRPSQTTVKI